MPIPDEQAALLAAIVAQPDEDSVRLIYADWLQENGDEEQARFIRDSISLTWLRDYEDDLREKIAKRIDDVCVQSGSQWLATLGVTGNDVVYDRGMAEVLVYDCLDQFLANASTLFAHVPVRAITIDDLELHERDGLAVLADMPDLRRLRELRLQNRWMPVSSDGWERFITSPHLRNLRELAVEQAGLTDDDMLTFDRAGYLRNLEELSLVSNQITAIGALSVVRSPRLPNLRRLRLAYNNIVEDRRRGSVYTMLMDALLGRFDSIDAIGGQHRG